MVELHWEILDEERKAVLPLFLCVKDRFYLAGGTALALQLGHRDSVDFDFFTNKSFSTMELFIRLIEFIKPHKLIRFQEEKDTLSVLIDKKIKVSFFSYPYKLLFPMIELDNFNMASIEDIGAMKLSAITSRSVLKDYVDLYWILKKFSLADLTNFCQKKYANLDINLVLKSLVYFEDINDEPIFFTDSGKVSFDEIKKFLSKEVYDFFV